jgi:hypothetical protein
MRSSPRLRLAVSFADLAREDACAKIFEHCLPYPHDHSWWAVLSATNLQRPMAEMVRYAKAYGLALKRVGQAAKQETLARWARRPFELADGMVIEREPFDRFLADGKALFAEHSIAVGEPSDSYLSKNIPLMRSLEAVGNLAVTTARSNGRMFGYLMTIMAPSFESTKTRTAVHTTFYASPLFPGLGLKLQRAAAADLGRDGVDELFLRAGSRGAGRRMAAIYQRLGAEFDGEIYRLPVGRS